MRTIMTRQAAIPVILAAAQEPSAAQDTAILHFALTLEYLESEFLTFARMVRDDELAHVEALRDALGTAAVAKPTFNFMNTTSDAATFRATAVVLEDTGVSAYNGQGPNLRKAPLAVAAGIVSVEARHAAWIRRVVGKRRPTRSSRRHWPHRGGPPRRLDPRHSPARTPSRGRSTGPSRAGPARGAPDALHARVAPVRGHIRGRI
jgi:ferritin-like protein